MPEEELTPEEKLLKVIQKGDEQESENEAAATSSEDSEGKVTTVATTAATTATKTKETTSADKPEAESSEDTPAVAVSPIAVALTRRSPLRVLNRAMLAVAAVLLCISGVEMWANIRSPLSPITQQPFETTAESLDSENFIADLSDTLDMYSKRRIFGKPDPVVIKPKINTTPVLAGWRAYIRKNYDFKGTSTVSKPKDDGAATKVMEAIILDNKTGRMHFLSVEQTVLVEKQTVMLKEITENNVTFSKGDEEVTLN